MGVPSSPNWLTVHHSPCSGRFGGTTFPPTVLFKVFIGMRGKGVKYINGKKMIKPSTEVSHAIVGMGYVFVEVCTQVRMSYATAPCLGDACCICMPYMGTVPVTCSVLCVYVCLCVLMRQLSVYTAVVAVVTIWLCVCGCVWVCLCVSVCVCVCVCVCACVSEEDAPLVLCTLCSVAHPPSPPIPPQAAEDARRLMGSRKYYDLMLTDACHHHQLKFTDEMDVTTVKEYMQVCVVYVWGGGGGGVLYPLNFSLCVCTLQFTSNLDEMPAHLGGRQNMWRRLDLEGVCGCVLVSSCAGACWRTGVYVRTYVHLHIPDVMGVCLVAEELTWACAPQSLLVMILKGEQIFEQLYV